MAASVTIHEAPCGFFWRLSLVAVCLASTPHPGYPSRGTHCEERLFRPILWSKRPRDSAAARLSSVTADACDLVTAARRLRSAPPRVCPHRQPSAARSDARAAPTQACTVNHRRIEHRSMVTPAASEVETRLPASPLQLWASPAQAKQTLLQKRRRVDAPRAHILGLPSRRARVKAEPTSCRRGGCGWAAGRPVAGARQAVARRRRSACYKFAVRVRFLSRVRIASTRGRG